MEADAKKLQAEKSSSEGSGSEPDEEYDSVGSDVSDDLMGKTSKKPKSDKVRIFKYSLSGDSGHKVDQKAVSSHAGS